MRGLHVVDATKLTAAILIVSGVLDILTPPETGAALAAPYGATYRLEPAHGHNVLLGEGARRIAEDVIVWVGEACSLGSQQKMTTVEQSTRSRVRSVGVSTRSDTPST